MDQEAVDKRGASKAKNVMSLSCKFSIRARRQNSRIQLCRQILHPRITNQNPECIALLFRAEQFNRPVQLGAGAVSGEDSFFYSEVAGGIGGIRVAGDE